MAKFTKKALEIATASFNADTAAHAEETLLRKYSKGGAISATDTRAIKIGRIASRMNFAATADGFEAAAAILDKPVKTRSDVEKKAYDAAGSALSRLLKRLDLKSGDARGREAGSKMPKPPQDASETPAEGASDVVEPVAPVKPLEAPERVAKAPLGDLRIPTLTTRTEGDLLVRNAVAFLVQSMSKNPTAFDAASTKAMRAIVAASDQLRADRRDNDNEPDH